MNVTSDAIQRIKCIFTDDEIPHDTCLRVSVQGGGCSGFQYGFELTQLVDPDDFVIEQQGVKVIIDPMSKIYLQDATLTFKSDLQGDVFVVQNPQATTTCGCGSSFSI